MIINKFFCVKYKCYIMIELTFLKSASKKSDICHYRYILYKGFKFQWYACNGCYDVLIISIKLNDIAM